jgi:sec-independent protein translocase protein TatC
VPNLKRKRPYVVVGCFVLGMLLTPPDVISQVLLALPMWLLYEFGILFSQVIVSRADKGADSSADNKDQKVSE